MRTLREGMRGEDIGFRNAYWSSNGSAIYEVIHEVSKDLEDRVHPVSYIVLESLKEASELWGFKLEPTTSDDSFAKGSERWKILKALWLEEAPTLEDYEGCEPNMGYFHETLWAAKVALEADEDPCRMALAVEKVARSERISERYANIQRIQARRYQGAIKALEDAKGLPKHLVAFVEEIGGGYQALAVYPLGLPKGGAVPPYFWITDDITEGVALGIYTSMVDGDEGDNLIFTGTPKEGDDDLQNPEAIEKVVDLVRNLCRVGVGFALR